MNKKYYKVVNSDLQSCVAYGDDAVQYTVGEFVFSKSAGTYLFVFFDLDSAIQFAGTKLLVYECEVEGICSSPYFIRNNNSLPLCTTFAYGVKLTNLVSKSNTPLHIGDVLINENKCKYILCKYNNVLQLMSVVTGLVDTPYAKLLEDSNIITLTLEKLNIECEKSMLSPLSKFGDLNTLLC